MTQPPDEHRADDDLAVQYVLGELSPAEEEAFEGRIDADAALREEVRRLRNAFDLLPYAAVTEPPPALRAAVLGAAAKARTPARTARAPLRTRTPRRIAWSRYAAAAAILLAVVLGIDGYRLRSELALQREVTALLQEPNVVRSFSLAGTRSAARAFGSVVLDLDAKKGAVVLRRLPVLPEDQVYRLWARVGDADVPCGDFVAGDDGAVRAPFPVPVESYTAPIAGVFVTVEPRSGGDRPTGPTVLESAAA